MTLEQIGSLLDSGSRARREALATMLLISTGGWRRCGVPGR